MLGVMEAKEVRLVVKTDEILRQALRVEAARRSVDMSELADEILRGFLAEAIAEVERQQQARKKKGS